TGFTGSVDSLAFCPAGDRVVTGGDEGALRFWDARSGRLMGKLMLIPNERAGTQACGWIAFTPEGYYDGSPGTEHLVRWRVGEHLEPASAWESVFHQPERVRRSLFGLVASSNTPEDQGD